MVASSVGGRGAVKEDLRLDADTIVASGNDQHGHVMTNFSCVEFERPWTVAERAIVGVRSG